jgi:hypothetical protein
LNPRFLNHGADGGMTVEIAEAFMRRANTQAIDGQA